jgi:hypothetical protein
MYSSPAAIRKKQVVAVTFARGCASHIHYKKILTMKTRPYLFPAGFLALLMLLFSSHALQAQRLSGSRAVAKESRDVTYFDAVRVSSAIDLVITQGEGFHVEVHADDNLLPYIQTSVRDGVLEIGLARGVSLRRYKEMKVYVSAPRFASLQASGSSDITARGDICGDALRIRASGSSDVRLNLDVKHLDIECSGSSDAILSGRAQSIKARLSGSSDMKGFGLQCDFLEVELSGSSDMYISVTSEVAGSLRGSSDLRIKGSPVVKVSTSGSSTVRSGR